MNNIIGNIREFGWVVFGRGSALVGGVLAIKVLTSLLPPEQYGYLALALTLPLLAQQFWAGPLSQSVIRYTMPLYEKGLFNELVGTSTRIYVVASLVHLSVCLLILFVCFKYSDFVRNMYMLFVLGALLSVIEPLFSLSQGFNTQFRKRAVVALFQSLFAVLRPLSAAFFVYLFCRNAVWAILGYLSVTFVLAGLNFRLVVKKIWFNRYYSAVLAKNFLQFSWPYLTWGWLAWLTLSGDRWILSNYFDSKVVGLYVAALQVGTILPRIGFQIISTFISPIINRRAGLADDLQRVNNVWTILYKISIICFILGCLGCWVIYVLKDIAISLITGPAYHVMAYAVPWFFLGSVFNQMAQLIFLIGPVVYQPNEFVFVRCLSYILTILMMLVLPKIWALDGMIAAFVLGGLLQFIFHAIKAKKIYTNFCYSV